MWKGLCCNVNFPNIPEDEIKVSMHCVQTVNFLLISFLHNTTNRAIRLRIKEDQDLWTGMALTCDYKNRPSHSCSCCTYLLSCLNSRYVEHKPTEEERKLHPTRSLFRLEGYMKVSAHLFHTDFRKTDCITPEDSKSQSYIILDTTYSNKTQLSDPDANWDAYALKEGWITVTPLSPYFQNPEAFTAEEKIQNWEIFRKPNWCVNLDIWHQWVFLLHKYSPNKLIRHTFVHLVT